MHNNYCYMKVHSNQLHENIYKFNLPYLVLLERNKKAQHLKQYGVSVKVAPNSRYSHSIEYGIGLLE